MTRSSSFSLTIFVTMPCVRLYSRRLATSLVALLANLVFSSDHCTRLDSTSSGDSYFSRISYTALASSTSLSYRCGFAYSWHLRTLHLFSLFLGLRFALNHQLRERAAQTHWRNPCRNIHHSNLRVLEARRK